MDTLQQTGQFAIDDTTYYMVSFVVIVVLFFIQRYSFYIDTWLSKKEEKEWKGKPWPLISGVTIGLLIYIFSLATPGGLVWDFSTLGWKEYSILLVSLFTLLGILIESLKNFTGVRKLLRFIIWTSLTAIYVIVGVYTGLMLSIALALFIVIYFIFFWKNRLKIQ